MNWYQKWENGFAEPDRRYAIYPIIHAAISDTERVEQYDACGFAGVVGNVSYSGRNAEENYPSKAAWDAAAAGAREYIRRGMHTWLYDECGYPSGTAGGYVTECHPEMVAQGLYCYDYWRPLSGPVHYRADVPGDRLWKALLVPIEAGEAIDVTGSLNKNGVLHIDVPEGKYYLFMMSVRRLFDGTHATESWNEPRNYVSLSDKAATRAFLDCTHEKYKELLGDEFGRGVLAMFTDEPSLISWGIRTGSFPILPWLESYPADFEAKYGYEFYKACVAVVLDLGPQKVKRRCDFWEFIADTVADGYFGPIREWCHQNGLKSSGHLLEEERLQSHVYCYGSFYRSMRQLDWPGIDQLETRPAFLMDTDNIPIARLVASFADISGEHEVFTEFSDHTVHAREGGHGALGDYYSSVNWHLAMGVNNFTSYYSWVDITDDQKRQLNRYTARSGWLLRQGRRDSTVAVFYPEAAMWDAYTPSTEERAVNSSEKTLRLDRTFNAVSWGLLHRQIDYDYIDCDLLLKGEIRDGRLCRGDRTYAAVILPCTHVLEDAAAEKLLALAAAGIPVLFCEDIPRISRETGDASPFADALTAACDGGGMYFAPLDGLDGLLDRLPALCRPVMLCTAGGTDHPELLSHCRLTEDGTRIAYLANMSNAPLTGVLQITGGAAEVAEANAVTGTIAPLPAGQPTTIQPGEGRFFLIKA